jgi:hypothetical protein
MLHSFFKGEGSESEKHDEDFDKVSLLMLRRDFFVYFCLFFLWEVKPLFLFAHLFDRKISLYRIKFHI